MGMGLSFASLFFFESKARLLGLRKARHQILKNKIYTRHSSNGETVKQNEVHLDHSKGLEGPLYDRFVSRVGGCLRIFERAGARVRVVT